MSETPDLLSELFITVFRLNGRLVEAGNALVLDLGLTSARWQVLGALAMAKAPLPVAHIARNMGLARQGVQRIVDVLAVEDLIHFQPNPHHRRAKLVLLTERGAAVFAAAMQRQEPWAAALATGLSAEDIETALDLLRTLDGRLAGRERTIEED